ncbi:MAG: SDR family NAD(P)-dependent oxidoreductase [Deltaproteobacteria bacterium]|nr:SDR family NAD(P)-dependent oxidoreductase [Deltaproteobacteria bacterium]
MSHYTLKNRYALITGASSGIGREIARCLAEEGAHCVLNALPSEAGTLDTWARELEARYRVTTWALPVDLATDDGPRELYDAVKRCVPHLDVLVNNAGILTYGMFHEIPRDMHERLLRINVRAYMMLMHYALSDMVPRRQGRILNISSMAAFQATSFQAPYGASKAFVQSLSEAVNLELRDKDIRICTLNPNLTDTPMINAYPRKIWLFTMSRLFSPAEIARKGVAALKRGRNVSIPGWDNWLLAHVAPRLLPRGWMNRVAYLLLKQGTT